MAGSRKAVPGAVGSWGAAGSARIAVVGAGYVGLTTAVCLAHLGHEVVCTDLDAARVALLNRGELPIVEAGLGELLAETLQLGSLCFTDDVVAAVPAAEVVYLCVQTPQRSDGSADLSYVQAAARQIAKHLKPGAIVVNKSTVPVGSTKVVERELSRPDVFVVSNPEFLREGSAVRDFFQPDRIVVGSDSPEVTKRVAYLYRGLDAPAIITTPATAETIKYASNAFLATKISFINAMAAVCEAVGADVSDVAVGMGYDRRIGVDCLVPGPGWGGSCFPKDTHALIQIAEEAGYDFHLLRGAVEVNNAQRRRVVRKIIAAAGGSVRDKRVAVWGLTFKAGTDDLRESPAVSVAHALRDHGATIVAYDPTTIGKDVDGVTTVGDPFLACADASVLAILTEWPEFRCLDLGRVAVALANPAVVDARNILDRDRARGAGLTYVGIGRA